MSLLALTKRWAELEDQLGKVEATKKRVISDYGTGDYVDADAFLNWKVKARSLISMACGKDSEHYQQFIKSEEPTIMGTSFDVMKRLRAVFLAAKEDYEGGYFNKFRNLVCADVFDSELDQAKSLFSAKYITASAIVAGVVLETTLRQLCSDAGIGVGKLERMNADLVKAGVYNTLVQKKITALAAVRNSAAHGKPEEFTEGDVNDMISYVESFVSLHL
jgi:hypothetical protein